MWPRFEHYNIKDPLFIPISDESLFSLRQIFFRVDNGGGDIVTRYSPKLHGAELCDGEWHKIKATKQHQQLTLTVDGLYFSNPRSSVDDQKSADTSDPLYIGGYPGRKKLFFVDMVSAEGLLHHSFVEFVFSRNSVHACICDRKRSLIWRGVYTLQESRTRLPTLNLPI